MSDDPSASSASPSQTRGWGALAEDWRAYVEMHDAKPGLERLLLPWRAPSLWALGVYRFGQAVSATPSSWKRRALRLMYGLAQPLVMRATKVSLPMGAEVGPGLWMAPHVPNIVAPGARLGARVRLFGGNTIGVGGRPGARGVPTIGNDVTLAPGAAVVGPVSIDAGISVGPSAVVTRSFPGARVLVGAPARPSLTNEVPWLPSAMHSPPSKTGADTAVAETFWQSFRADVGRYLVYQPNAAAWRKLKLALEVDGLWALAVYRFGRVLKTGRRRFWSRAAWPVYGLGAFAVRAATGIHLDVDARIGPGFYIGHFGSIFVGPGAQVGRNSSISQMCCVSAEGGRPDAGSPVLGDRVYLGAGCKVLGKISIGDGAAIGANAVVTSDIPTNAVATGIPASVVSFKGSGDFIYLGDSPRETANRQARAVAASVVTAANVVSAAQVVSADEVAAPMKRNVVSPLEIARASASLEPALSSAPDVAGRSPADAASARVGNSAAVETDAHAAGAD